MTYDWNGSQQNQKQEASPGEIQLKSTGQSLFQEVGQGTYSQTQV